jgi:hypothetical protein
MMNENRIISWEEAERILSDSNTGPVKCSLPPQTRPSEPDNDTDVEQCIRKLQANDPNLTQINLNNMKVGRLEVDENIYWVSQKTVLLRFLVKIFVQKSSFSGRKSKNFRFLLQYTHSESLIQGFQALGMRAIDFPIKLALIESFLKKNFGLRNKKIA